MGHRRTKYILTLAILVAIPVLLWAAQGKTRLSGLYTGFGPTSQEAQIAWIQEQFRYISLYTQPVNYYMTESAAESLAHWSNAPLGSLWFHRRPYGTDYHGYVKFYDRTIREVVLANPATGVIVAGEADPLWDDWRTSFKVARDYGTAQTSATLQAAITALGSTKRTLYIPAGNYSVTANLTFPSTLALWFEQGAILSVSAGDTVTIGGPVISPTAQIFDPADTTGVVRWLNGSPVYPEYWGAVPDGSTDCAPAINAAIKSVDFYNYPKTGSKPSRVVFRGGVYVIGSTIILPNRVILSGESSTWAGSGTEIKLKDNADCVMLQTSKAAGGSVSFGSGIERMIFNGNRANQTRASEYAAIEFHGVYISCFIRDVLINAVHGPGLTLNDGSDLVIDNVEIYGCTTDSYAFSVNKDYTPASWWGRGLVLVSQLFVEYTITTAGYAQLGASVTNTDSLAAHPDLQGNAILIEDVAAFIADVIHTEACANGVTIAGRGENIDIRGLSGAWLGDGVGGGLVYIAGVPKRLHIGGGMTGGTYYTGFSLVTSDYPAVAPPVTAGRVFMDYLVTDPTYTYWTDHIRQGFRVVPNTLRRGRSSAAPTNYTTSSTLGDNDYLINAVGGINLTLPLASQASTTFEGREFVIRNRDTSATVEVLAQGSDVIGDGSEISALVPPHSSALFQSMDSSRWACWYSASAANTAPPAIVSATWNDTVGVDSVSWSNVTIQHDGVAYDLLNVELESLTNASFETGNFTGWDSTWQGYAQTASTVTDSVAHDSTYSYHHAQSYVDATSHGRGIHQTDSLVRGETYLLRCWVYATSCSTVNGIKLILHGAGHWPAAQATLSPSKLNQWVQLSLIYTIPLEYDGWTESPTSAYIQLRGLGNAYFDDVELYNVTDAVPTTDRYLTWRVGDNWLTTSDVLPDLANDEYLIAVNDTGFVHQASAPLRIPPKAIGPKHLATDEPFVFTSGAAYPTATYDAGGVPNPPTDTALNVTFPNAPVGFARHVRDTNDGKIYWVVKKAASDWWYIVLTEAGP